MIRFITAALLMFSLSAEAYFPLQAIPWNVQRQPCNFKCKEIPEAHEVLEGFGKYSTTELLNPHINVLAWNIFKGRKQAFNRDMSLLARGKDIILIQEATDESAVKPTVQNIPYGWIFGKSFFMKDNFATGLMNGSYAQPRFVDYTRTEDLEPFVKSPKLILIHVYYHKPSRTNVLVMNIHGINWVSDEKFARQINSVLPYVAKHQGPIIFIGDFNIHGPNRLNIVKNSLAPFGMTRIPWENPPEKKQFDDGFIRGLTVVKARYIHQVKDVSSDHPALDLEVFPTPQFKRK